MIYVIPYLIIRVIVQYVLTVGVILTKLRIELIHETWGALLGFLELNDYS